MKRGEKQFATADERRKDVIAEYLSMSDKPDNMTAFAKHLGISRAYLYKMRLSMAILRNIEVAG